jgi:hypothetical protein
MEAESLDRQRIENTRFPRPGRPKGMAFLTDQKKAAIVFAKNLQVLTQSMIAQEHDVSRVTVNQLDENSLSPEAKKHLKTFTDKLGEIREETSDLILEKIRDKSIKDGVLPSLLNIANQNYRLETSQPTQIIETQQTQANIVAKLIAEGIYNEFEAEQFAQRYLNGSVDGEIVEDPVNTNPNDNESE